MPLQTELDLSADLRQETRPEPEVTITEPEVSEAEPEVAVSGAAPSVDELLLLVQRLQEEKAAY